jgi:hypothetical protein
MPKIYYKRNQAKGLHKVLKIISFLYNKKSIEEKD